MWMIAAILTAVAVIAVLASFERVAGKKSTPEGAENHWRDVSNGLNHDRLMTSSQESRHRD